MRSAWNSERGWGVRLCAALCFVMALVVQPLGLAGCGEEPEPEPQCMWSDVDRLRLLQLVRIRTEWTFAPEQGGDARLSIDVVERGKGSMSAAARSSRGGWSPVASAFACERQGAEVEIRITLVWTPPSGPAEVLLKDELVYRQLDGVQLDVPFPGGSFRLESLDGMSMELITFDGEGLGEGMRDLSYSMQ